MGRCWVPRALVKSRPGALSVWLRLSAEQRDNDQGPGRPGPRARDLGGQGGSGSRQRAWSELSGPEAEADAGSGQAGPRAWLPADRAVQLSGRRLPPSRKKPVQVFVSPTQQIIDPVPVPRGSEGGRQHCVPRRRPLWGPAGQEQPWALWPGPGAAGRVGASSWQLKHCVLCAVL